MKSDPTRYIWLAAAAALLFVAGGDQPVFPAAWLAPVFLVRFLRCSGALAGPLLALAAISVAQFSGLRAMSILPVGTVLVSLVVGGAIDLLPFVLDRVLHRRLRGAASTLVLPAAMVTLVWVSTVTGARTYASILYGSHDDVVLLQLLSLTGVWGLVFLPFWGAAVVNLAWERGFAWERVRRPLGALAAVLLLVHGFGAVRLARFSAPEESVRVAGVPISNEERRTIEAAVAPLFTAAGLDEEQLPALRETMQEVLDSILERTRQQARAGAELVVWSEAAVLAFGSGEESILDQAREVARDEGITLGLTVATAEEGFAEKMRAGERFLHNKLVMVAPDGTVAWEYSKARLVPWAFEARTAFPGDGELHTLETPSGLLSGAICYDLDDPTLMRPAGRRGVRLLVAPSNDWAQIRHMHAGVARLRAIENGFALLRPTSQGISLAIDPFGRIVGEADTFVDGGAPLVAELPLRRVTTLYSRIGDTFAHACALGTMVLAGLALLRRRRGTAREPASPAAAPVTTAS